MNPQLSITGEQLVTRFYALKTREDIAKLLEVDERRLIYHLYVVPPEKRYKHFNIPKKYGGVRDIAAPATALKILQRKLNQVLQEVYGQKPKPAAHGFVRNRSIVTNAHAHAGRRHVLNLDLKDFFPSIHFGRVLGMFQGEPYHLPYNVALVLAQICCFNEKIGENTLPQGAPTSPIIASLICRKMDSQLQQVAAKYRSFYTRYADDLTFSTWLRIFPSSLATLNEAGQTVLGDELIQIIQNNHFQINEKKIRLFSEDSRKEVTGLTVNIFPNVRRTYVRQTRAMLHAWRKFGLQNASVEFFAKYDYKHRNPSNTDDLFRTIVKGRIEFIGMVRGKNDDIYVNFRKQLKKLAPEFVKETFDPRIQDEFTKFEYGLERFWKHLGKAGPNQVKLANLDRQLRDNIDTTRNYGDTDTQKSDRNRILHQLDKLALATSKSTFRDFYRDWETQGTEAKNIPEVTHILFLAANPADWEAIKTGAEHREIENAVRASDYRDSFVVYSQQAVRDIDLQDKILRYKPTILHFSGHGTKSNEIILEDVNGNGHPVTPEALRTLFAIYRDQIRCVVLNACYSEPQAQAIAEHIDVVIGMAKPIIDNTAIDFSTAFYKALGYGKDIETAFKSAAAEIELRSPGEKDTPRIIALRTKASTISFVKTRK